MKLSKLKVTKGNGLIQAKYSRGLVETRIVDACIAQIDSKHELTPERIFELTAEELFEMSDLDNMDAVYHQLKVAAKNLIDQKLLIPEAVKWINWFSSVEAPPGEGKIKVRFSVDIKPYLFAIEGNFTSYIQKHTLRFKGSYMPLIQVVKANAIFYLRHKFDKTQFYLRFILLLIFSCSIQAENAAFPTVTLNANPVNVNYNSTSLLTWTTSNATSCLASGGWSGTKGPNASGNNTPKLTSATTFVLSCTGPGGTASDAVTVGVGPTLSFNTQDTTVPYNGNTVLNWSSVNASSCTASGGWSGTQSASGSFTTPPLTKKNHFYTSLYCCRQDRNSVCFCSGWADYDIIR